MFPDYGRLAEAVFHSRPDDILALRAICDRTDALRAEFGPEDPRVQAGERQANELKGMFTRRIAWACHQQDARIGLRRKDVGQHATRGDGVAHSTDALMLRDTGQICDVMSDRDWSWNANPDDTQPLDQWLAPLPEPGDAPVPVPQPLPGPTVPPAVDLTPRLVALEQLVVTQGATLESQRQQLAALEQRLHLVEDRPGVAVPPLPKLVAVGKVRMFGLSYDIRLPVVMA